MGKITGVTATMEYQSSAGAWTDVTGIEIDGLTAGTYQVRVKATATSFESAAQTITLTDPAPGAEATPSIEVDYMNEELSGFEIGGSYTIDGTPVTPDSGKLEVASYLGATLSIVKKGNGATTTDSDVQNLVVLVRTATPTATGVNPTTVGGVGKITDVSAAMEYKSSTGNWMAVTGTEIIGLTAGTYQIRVKPILFSHEVQRAVETISCGYDRSLNTHQRRFRSK